MSEDVKRRVDLIYKFVFGNKILVIINKDIEVVLEIFKLLNKYKVLCQLGHTFLC